MQDDLQNLPLSLGQLLLTNLLRIGLRMTTLQEAAQLALEALKLAKNSHGTYLMSDPPQDAWKAYRVDNVIAAAIESLRTALAQQVEQQPVAWMDESGWCTQSAGLAVLHEKHCGKLTPLYANAPPPR